MAKKIPPLTEEQKLLIQQSWSSVDLKSLTKLVYKDESLDGHTSEAKQIKEYIATFASSEEIKEKLATTKFKKLPDLILTQEQEEFIKNNYKQCKIQEIVNELFDKDGTRKLSTLSLEYRKIYAFVGTLDPVYIPIEDRIVDSDEYEPPTSITRLVPLVNKHWFRDADEGKKYLYADDLKSGEIRQLKDLYAHMRGYRFIHQASSYKKSVQRELFIASFIKFTWGKDELIPEDIEVVVDLCTEIVTVSQIDRLVQRLDLEIQEMLDGTDEKKRLSTNLIELLNNQREKLDVAKKRKEGLLKILVGNRSDRMKLKINDNASILNLVTAFKQEETRKQLLELAKMEKLAEENEVNKLSSLESVSALIAGITKQEVR